MPRGMRIVPTVQPSELDKSYAAGFIDGEGCITVRVNLSNLKRGWQGGWYASLAVSQTEYNVATLHWLSARWGGAVRKMATPKRKEWSQGYEWCIVGQMFYSCMDDLMNYLIIKRPQAENAMKLRAMRHGLGTGSKLTPEELDERRAIEVESKRLNQRRRAD